MNESQPKLVKIDGNSHETKSRRFPIIDMDEIYYGNESPPLQKDVIVHYLLATFRNEKRHYFRLLRIIEGLNYVFRCSQWQDSLYQFSFKTEEYDYATTNIGQEGQTELAATISGFIESICGYEGVNINEINVSPADASYSSQEIEECTQTILASRKNKLTKDELTSSYKGFEVFDLYRELFGKNFHKQHYDTKSRANGRSRFFKQMFRKCLPDWQVDDRYRGADFSLKKKDETRNGN